ncbi:MAG: TRAP transporter small permease [Alphaproteobacteria bacterium]|nr:TRAP transporter small permease [Alphaproteobacteria bacterium]
MAIEAKEDEPRTGWRAHVESAEQLLMNVAFVVLLGAIGWGVLSRHVVTTPSAWVEEVSALAYCWLIFVGAAEVHRRGQHVSVDLLTSTLPSAARRMLALLVEAGVVGLCLYVAWLGVRQTIASHSSTTSMLRMPLSFGFAGLTAGFALMAARGAQRLLRQIARPDGER